MAKKFPSWTELHPPVDDDRVAHTIGVKACTQCGGLHFYLKRNDEIIAVAAPTDSEGFFADVVREMNVLRKPN